MLEQLIVESTVEPHPHLYLGLLGLFMLLSMAIVLMALMAIPSKVDPVVIQNWREIDAPVQIVNPTSQILDTRTNQVIGQQDGDSREWSH